MLKRDKKEEEGGKLNFAHINACISYVPQSDDVRKLVRAGVPNITFLQAFYTS